MQRRGRSVPRRGQSDLLIPLRSVACRRSIHDPGSTKRIAAAAAQNQLSPANSAPLAPKIGPTNGTADAPRLSPLAHFGRLNRHSKFRKTIITPEMVKQAAIIILIMDNHTAPRNDSLS